MKLLFIAATQNVSSKFLVGLRVNISVMAYVQNLKYMYISVYGCFIINDKIILITIYLITVQQITICTLLPQQLTFKKLIPIYFKNTNKLKKGFTL